MYNVHVWKNNYNTLTNRKYETRIFRLSMHIPLCLWFETISDVYILSLKCSNTLYLFQDKLVETNRLFWRAVDNTRNLPHNINLIIPPGICQEQNYNRTRRVQGSAFITSFPGSIVQPGACGEPGYQLNLGFTNTRRNRQLNENLENMVYLTRFLYGVFPEHGVKSSSRFPLFYRNRSEVS